MSRSSGYTAAKTTQALGETCGSDIPIHIVEGGVAEAALTRGRADIALEVAFEAPVKTKPS
jgi:hypothetical protein